MSGTKPDFDAARHLETMSPLLRLPIAPEKRSGVEQFLNVAFAMSQIVEKAPVNPDACDLAAVFRPGAIGAKP
jgi:hypothetical protein